MLKYFPGPLEPIATMVIPGAIVGFLMLLPFVDRGGGRHPFRAPRRMLTATLLAIGVGIVALTGLGFADLPAGKDPNDWGLLPIAGCRSRPTRPARARAVMSPAARPRRWRSRG